MNLKSHRTATGYCILNLLFRRQMRYQKECEKAIPKFILKMSTETHQQILKTTEFLKVIHSQCRKLDNWDAFCMFYVTISILQCKQVLVCSYLQVQQERHNSAYRDHKQESGATTLHKLLVICIFGAFHNRDWT